MNQRDEVGILNMEDDNGLELSLGLGFCGSSIKSKGKNGSSFDTGTEDEKADKPKNDFKFLLGAIPQNNDPGGGSHSHRGDSVKLQENFFHDLTSRNADGDASGSLNARALWVGSSNRSTRTEEEKRSEGGGNKRKIDFDDVSTQKRQESDGHRVDFHDKKASHISITEDGSTAENEDVAESEVEGSTSRLVSQHDEGSKRLVGVVGHEDPKDFQRFPDACAGELQGQRRHSGLPENEFKHGINFGVPYSVKPSTVMSMSYQFPMKDHHPASSAGTKSMTPIGSTSNAIQTVNPDGSPITFGYLPVHLPTLDKNSSWGRVSQQQQLQPPYKMKAPANSDKHNEGLRISQAMQIIGRNPPTEYDSRVFELPKGDGKQHTGEQGSSSKAENEGKGSSGNVRANDSHNQRTADGFSLDFSAIKPGISPDVKLGGCGSYPNLPWVSTTAPGPNGRTISGVTYRYSPCQIRIVCACHGSHMSPEEFIRHAIDGNATATATATGEGNDGVGPAQRSTNTSASARG
ncbi:Ninja-family protein mc410 [Linum perenne]